MIPGLSRHTAKNGRSFFQSGNFLPLRAQSLCEMNAFWENLSPIYTFCMYLHHLHLTRLKFYRSVFDHFFLIK